MHRFVFRTCEHCKEPSLVLDTHTEFTCKHCSQVSQVVLQDKTSSSPAILTYCREQRLMSSEFRDSILNPIMSQKGANQNRRFG